MMAWIKDSSIKSQREEKLGCSKSGMVSTLVLLAARQPGSLVFLWGPSFFLFRVASFIMLLASLSPSRQSFGVPWIVHDGTDGTATKDTEVDC